MHDFFISHASEDKDAFVRPLATLLHAVGLDVWYDEFSLKAGDSLSGSINQGLASSRFGLVVLSPSFFRKRWPVAELDSLVTAHVSGRIKIIPIWHEIGYEAVAAESPMLANLFAIRHEDNLDAVVAEVLDVIRPSPGLQPSASRALLEAMAFTYGTGLPRSGGTWLTIANALSDDIRVSQPDLDKLLETLGHLLVRSTEEGTQVYRLASPRLGRLLTDVVTSHRGGEGPQVLHRRIAVALIQAFVGDAYSVSHLADHVAAADCWDELARRPDVLDRLDPDAVADALLRTKFGKTAVPADVAAVLMVRDLLAVAPLDNRSVIRELAAAERHGGRYRGQRPDEGFWRLRWARFHHRDPLYAVITRRSPARDPARPHADSLDALAAWQTNGGHPRLVTGDHGGVVRVWDPLAGELVAQFQHGAHPVTDVEALLVDGTTVVAAVGEDGVLRTWDLTTRRVLVERRIVDRGALWALGTVHRNDDAVLVTAGDDQYLRLVDPLGGAPIGRPMAGHQDSIRCLTTLPGPQGEHLVATSGMDGTIRIWDTTTCESFGQPIDGHCRSVEAIAALVPGTGQVFLATGGQGGMIRVVNAQTGVLGPPPIRADSHRVLGLVAAQTPGGVLALASCGTDRAVRLWRPHDGQTMGIPLTGHRGFIRGIAAVTCSDGRRLLVTSSRDSSLRLWDLSGIQSPRGPKSEPPRKYPPKRRPDPTPPSVKVLATVPGRDARPGLVVIGRSDNTLQVVDAIEGHPQAVVPRMAGQARAVTTISLPKRHLLAAAFGDKELVLWDVERARIFRRLLSPLPRPIVQMSAATCVDGAIRLAVCGTDGSFALINVRNGSVDARGVHPGGNHYLVGIVPIGGLSDAGEGQAEAFATAGRRRVRLWNATDGQPLTELTLRTSTNLRAIAAIREQGGQTFVATAGTDDRVRIELWDPTTQELVQRINGDGGKVTALTSWRLPSGTPVVITGTENHTVDVWNVSNGERIHQLNLTRPIVSCAALETGLAIATSDGVVMMEISDVA